MSFVILFSVCSSRFLALDKCFAMAIDIMFRLTVCWNQVDGVVVWCVSPYVSVDSSQAPSKLASLSLYSTTYSLSVNSTQILLTAEGSGPLGGFIHSGG